MTTSTTRTSGTNPPSRLRIVVLLVIGVFLCIAVGVFARQVLVESRRVDPDEHAALPRPRNNAPFIVSPDLVVDQMTAMAKLTADDLVYDLGCGDGRIVITACMKSGCRGVGFDIDPQRVTEAQENARLHDVAERVTFEERDIYQVDLSPASVIVMYLLPKMVNDLVPQLEQMKPGSRILSHEFWLEGIRPQRSIEVFTGPDRNDRRCVYMYVTPLVRDPAMEIGRPPLPDETIPYQAEAGR